MPELFNDRRVRAFGLGALLTFAMFWTLQMLIVGGKYTPEGAAPLATVDFVRLKKESELETRTRKKPEKPPPPKQPPPPQLKVATPQPQKQVPEKFLMPKMNLARGISGGPFLGGYTAADASAYGELIPLVRIAPQYPRTALRDGIEGWVDIEVTVNADGTVRSARPVAAQPRGVFEAAAVQSIMKWKFKPKIEDGKPVEQRAIQRLDFKLGEE